MNKIEELIQQYCPDGVEYVKFVDYANVLYGCPFDASKFTDDKSFIPLIRIRDVLSGKAGTYYTGEFSKEYIIKKGDVLVGMDGNFNLGVWDDIDGLLCQRVCKLYTKDENKLLNGYIRHYMKPVFRQIEESTAGGSVKHLSARAINAIEIPLPPLPVQEEIVRILDNFTTLEAELEAELDCRKRQYEYYRDKLLNKSKSENEYKRVKLGEIGTFTRGRRFVHADDRDEGIPCIHYGELYTHYGVWADKVKTHINPELTTNFRYADKNDVIIVAAGENNVDIGIGVAWLGNEKVAVHDACFIFKHNQNPKFISYALRTYDYHQQIKSKVSQGKICSISADGLANAEIPLPPLDVQERIVNVLDNFEQLCNDLGIGLPAEIEARKKQYEYYRNKLLSFTPPSN